MITKEQYKTLQPYEGMLRSAIDSNYARCSREAFTVLLSVYNVLPTTVVKALPSKYNCPACALSVIKATGRAYFEYKEWYDKWYANRHTKRKQDLNTTPVEGAE